MRKYPFNTDPRCPQPDLSTCTNCLFQHIELVHPELGGVSKAQIREKLAKQLKVKEE